MAPVPLIIVHGGVETPRSEDDGPAEAAKYAFDFLVQKGVVDAVVEAVSVLENDVRFDAGFGSYLHLDGSIQMDAAVMDSSENMGCVIGLRDTKNPIYVARDILDIPHNVLAGQGAIDFARQMGHPAFDCTSNESIQRLEGVKEMLRGRKPIPKWAANFKKFKKRSDLLNIYLNTVGHDTVGAVARDTEGNFAVAVSTGGTSFMIPGRVGDSALVGSGFYAGKKGAVCTTGIGEEIQRKVLAKAVYDVIDHGEDPQSACDWGLELFEASVPVGIVAVTRDEYGVASNEEMAQFVLEGEE